MATDRSPHHHNERYADMRSELDSWEHSKRQRQSYDANWAFKYPEAPVAPLPYAFGEEETAVAESLGSLQLSQIPKTRTSPVSTRTSPVATRTSPVTTRMRVARHGSQPHAVRPTSSGGDSVMQPYRQYAPPRRAESYSHPTPLEEFRRSRRWPPSGFRSDDALSPKEADDLICAGTSTFKGYWDEIPNTPPGYDRYYAVMENEHQTRTDRASLTQPAYRDMSLNIVGPADSQFPWHSLEQPCMAYAYGKSAGTTTLNYWVSKSGSGLPPTKLVGDARPRRLKFLQILDRLQHLENGLEEDVSP
jgi:hypothetical protein